MHQALTQRHSFINPRRRSNEGIKSLPKNISPKELNEELKKLGILLTATDCRTMYAMDAVQQPVTTPSIGLPVQYAQVLLPGIVNIVTAIRTIDKLAGASIVGDWPTVQVVQRYLEASGQAQFYSDYTQPSLASWNLNFEVRTVVRLELGMLAGVLESENSSLIGVNNAAELRKAVIRLLDIERNRIGMYGLNNGDNLTYGFLNDPTLPDYEEVAEGSSGSTLWANKTYLEIIQDIEAAAAALQANSQGNINPSETKLRLAVANSVYQWLNRTTDFSGTSVINYIKTTYPFTDIISVPELDSATGGDNAFYLFAETVNDIDSTDDERTLEQLVIAKLKMVGTEQRAKGYLEVLSNATAGTLCKRAYAVVRYFGV